ncbi:Major facilitator superfamily protein [Prunus dulcis]|uniref:Major facilitator superfamily protein n=1 Tax=Prunus dulcis TaxID=3755 RepID=A0A4Y1RQS0_PRUDU|nr:Major facilitator superfamily protein [Prunus dulcis]
MPMDSAASHDLEKPLLVDDLPVLKRRSHARDVHILSCAFLLIFLAFGATQNLESTLITEKNLGTTSLGILYLSFAFFSLVASSVVRALGSKNSLILGTLATVSLYLGFASAIIWVEQGTYLTAAARSHARDNGLHEGTIIGNFNGEFWGMFACRQFVGNLLPLVLLRGGTEGNQSDTTLLFTVFLCSMTLGTILMCFLNKRDDEEEKDPHNAESLSLYASLSSLSKSIVAPMFDVRMVLIIPLMAYTGLQQAFVWAEFTKYIVSPMLGVSGVGGAMAVYGAFDAACSLTAGRLTSGLKSITLIVSGGAFVQAVIFLWLLLCYSPSTGILGTINLLIMAALLGIGDGVFNTQLSALIGIFFKDDTEGAFAQLKVWQCSAVALIFFISPYISLQAMLVLMLSAICLSYAAFVYLSQQGEKHSHFKFRLSKYHEMSC